MSWLERDDRTEVDTKPKWTPEPKCTCSHGGEPFLLDGVMVTVRDPSCRVHPTTLCSAAIPLSVETMVGNWKDTEKKDGRKAKAKVR